MLPGATGVPPGKDWIQAVLVDEPRTVDQNKRMWGLLHDIEKQLKWPVNGYEDYITADDWKDIVTAGMTKHQRVAQGIEGGWVLLGQRTHKLKKPEMSELIDYILAFGNQKGINWTVDDDQSRA